MKSLALAAAFVLAAVVSGHAATLRSNVTVEDQVIRLGDLFDSAGAAADVAVARAPAPGRRNSYDVNWLYQVARAYNVDWRPQSRFDRIVVERAGRLVPTSEIVARIAAALADEGLRAGSEIELSQRQLEVMVALDAPATVEVRNVSFERQSGRFTAIVLVGGTHPSAQRLALAGRTFAMAEVPVLRRAVGPGEVIRPHDVEMVRVRESALGRETITDPNRLYGTTPRLRLRAGEPIRETDTRPPVLVARNNTVTIVLQTGNMTLTAQGRAAEEGAKGDVIRVMNLQSKKTIEAVVTGPDLVAVNTGHRVIN